MDNTVLRFSATGTVTIDSATGAVAIRLNSTGSTIYVPIPGVLGWNDSLLWDDNINWTD